MRFLLDTNIVSVLAPGKKKAFPVDKRVIEWFEQHHHDFGLATISLMEIESGIQRLRRAGAEARADDLTAWLVRIVDLYGSRIIPLDAATAIAAGALEASALSKGRSPGTADLLIAATARVRNLILLTRNLRHFEALGMTPVDPFKALPE